MTDEIPELDGMLDYKQYLRLKERGFEVIPLGGDYQIGDPCLVRDRRGEVIAQQFKQRCPRYLPTDNNYDSMVRTLAFNLLSTAEQNLDDEGVVDLLIESGHWTVPNLERSTTR